MNQITTLPEALAAIPSADILTWTRYDGTHRKGELVLFHDDLPNDRRRIHTITLFARTARIERRTLKDYDEKKHRWTTYGPSSEPLETDAKGRKALLAEIQRRAQVKTGYPNPVIFTSYPKEEATKPAYPTNESVQEGMIDPTWTEWLKNK
jgi:hypothetical protein